ncbi:MAG: hybrid sensor histidine kinase/response regulator [Verrucomicrobia bacterium]|nr:MAG: hybrid sensor histidine kinase/response regulator [Verrucomicrobiota bacterium]
MRATKETQVHTRQQRKPNRTNSHQRKNNENRRKTSRKIPSAKDADYHQLVARATNDAIRDWDLGADALTWRQGLNSLLGYSPGESDTIAFWRQRIHRDDCARVAASIREAIKSKAGHWSGEYRFRHANGHYLSLLERASIIRDKNGRAVRFLGALMDVSARKQLQEKFSHSQKMEAFGQLAGGVAHDFNNFLTTILGYSDLLVAEVEGRGTGAKYLSEIRSAAGRAASLTKQLLTFSRREPLEPRVLEVNKLIHNLERSILRLLGENISVLCDLIPEKKYIKVDPDQFTQIIINLAVNARDAMPVGGTLLLKTQTIFANGKAPSEMPPGKYIGISITDNGIGMSDEVKEHLFEPFFTTKDDRHASGLGLATCYGIVRQSGGRITIESELAKGTAVYIYLPEAEAPPAAPYRKRSKLPPGNETILVVEDDISVRHVAVRTLRMLGYNVLEAFRADEAKRLIKNNAINLVVSDVVLPDMSGCDFADWMRLNCPSTQVLLTSGYLPETTIGRPSIDLPFLSKPFDPQQLAETVRASLDALIVS